MLTPEVVLPFLFILICLETSYRTREDCRLPAATQRVLQRPTNLILSTWVLYEHGSFGEHQIFNMYSDEHHSGVSALHLLANFGIFSMMSIDLETLQRTSIDVRVSRGRTPLYMACRNGHLNDVKLLVARGANKNAEDNFGQSPLHYAVLRGHKEAKRFLLEIDVKSTAESTLDGAIEIGEDTITQMLLDSIFDHGL